MIGVRCEVYCTHEKKHLHHRLERAILNLTPEIKKIPKIDFPGFLALYSEKKDSLPDTCYSTPDSGTFIFLIDLCFDSICR